MRPSFQEVYMDLATSIARRSTCVRTSSSGERMAVGCVITSTDFRKVLAVGYNGNASGLPNQCDSTTPGACGCFISSTLVRASSVERAYRRRYVGDVLRIVTRNNNVTVTPNHPVLAPGRGWIPAEALAVNDHLLQMKRGENELASAPHNYDGVPIEQVFESLLVTGRLVRRSGTGHDFHGDGLVDEDVDVVSADGRLTAHGEPGPLKLVRDPALSRPFQETPPLSASSSVLGTPRARSSRESRDARRPLVSFEEPRLSQSLFHHDASYSEHSRDGGSGLSTLVSGGHLLDGHRKHGLPFVSAEVLGSLAQDPTFTQTILNGGVRDPELLSEHKYGLASQVALDQVIHIQRQHRTTHVYNLQTSTGWYSAGRGDMLAKNCLHAEENAVINCDVSRDTKKVVFCTHLPCKMCSKRLVNLGNVVHVLYLNDYRLRDSLEIFREVNIRAEMMLEWRLEKVVAQWHNNDFGELPLPNVLRKMFGFTFQEINEWQAQGTIPERLKKA